MRKLTNLLVWIAAAAICGLMVYISWGADFNTFIYNCVFLGIMLLIILVAVLVGFLRMGQTVKGLDTAADKLMAVYKDRSGVVELTKAGATIFAVDYLDRKYQEYLGYLRKTNSPADIGDYIGEYEINNYTHRRLVEMVPDFLTSLGILGTFMGLVWGLQGFNPVSYEAMASSISSLINGIKVAFVTSIFGITLSLAYSYSLRGRLTAVSESLDNFLDKYYLCAVSPTDATAMNHILANQKEQIQSLQGMSKEMADQVAVSFSDHVDPVMNQMASTMNDFTRIVTDSQSAMLENVANQVTSALKKEFASEFVEMRRVLKDSVAVQKDFIDYLTKAQSQFEKNLSEGQRQFNKQVSDAELQMRGQISDSQKLYQKQYAEGQRQLTEAISQAAEANEDTYRQLKQQQENLTEFTDYMARVIASMSALTDANVRAKDAMNRQIEVMQEVASKTLSSASVATNAVAQAQKAADKAKNPPAEIKDLDELTGRLDEMIDLLNQERRMLKDNKKKGFFR